MPVWPRLKEALEDVMSKESISIIIAIVVIALMFAWVPLVNYVCPPGWSSKETSADKEKEQDRVNERQPPKRTGRPDAVPVSGLSSKRLREQSRDLCEAISARRDRAMARSESTASQIPSAFQ
jgi:hypothetical protein